MDGSHAPRDVLADWRASGADRVDPLRFHRIEALQRRASRFEGEARRLLDERLAALVEAHARTLANAGPAERGDSRADASGTGIGELLERLAGRRAATEGSGATDPAAAAPAAAAALDAAAGDAAIADAADVATRHDLDTVHALRRIWSSVRTRSHVRASLREAPGDAGPLNSTRLVHRALGLMQDAAPGYLEHFMAYVDALSCLERMDGVAGGVESPAATSGARPAARARARRRKS